MRTARNFVTKEQVEAAKKVNAVEFFRAYRPEELVEHSANTSMLTEDTSILIWCYLNKVHD